MNRLAVLLALSCSAPSLARAHDRSISHARVVVRGDGATVQLRLRALDRNALEAEGLGFASLEPHLQRSVALESASGPCVGVPGSFTELDGAAGWSRYEWRVRCAGAAVRLRAAPVPTRTSHVCFVEVRWPATGRSAEYVLSELALEAELAPGGGIAASGPALLRWIPVGVEHIGSGLDHLLFLAMLLLLAGSARETAAMVTGFTLGHSVTLAAAALDVVQVETTAVEAVIGLSVALVAVENVWLSRERRDRATPAVACAVPLGVAVITGQPAFAGIALFAACHFALVARSDRPAAWRWGIASVFGLLHGFGFAGALADGGLPAESTVGALLGFNVGVELGQLMVVLLVWPVLAWISRTETWRVRTIQVGSAAGAAAGTYWFVTRAFA